MPLFIAMEMKKVACAVLFAAASVSAVMAHGGEHPAAPAPAPGPSASSGAAALGSFVGASLLSFVAYYVQL
ncbi:hypothetical protein RIF29_38400 [Crotalaria pallida]|uniref:Uncharacterized protein n=1 Tax=Crotalaria pallida TaxID=3830 RepID=A0AAN9E4M9_CROPI